MKKIAITIPVLVNVFVLIVAIWLVSGGGIKLLIENFVRPAHERWVSQFGELDIKLGNVVFLGDSITARGAWQEIFPNAVVRNRGIGGDDARGVLARIDQVSSGRPAQVFLLIGANDLGIGVAEADIVANIRKILDEIHSLSPQTQIYVQSIMPRSIEFRARIESLNQAIHQRLKGRQFGSISIRYFLHQMVQ